MRQLVGYVESTRSDDGGYCFYRLNESNAADTFYAVYVLTALNRPVPEPELTADFLQQRQGSDGSFQSIYSADYVLRALDLLGVPPLFDPNHFLHSQLKLRSVSHLKSPITSSAIRSFNLWAGPLRSSPSGTKSPRQRSRLRSLQRYACTSVPREDSALTTHRSIRRTMQCRRSPSPRQTASRASPSGYGDASGRREDSRRRPSIPLITSMRSTEGSSLWGGERAPPLPTGYRPVHRPAPERQRRVSAGCRFRHFASRERLLRTQGAHGAQLQEGIT